MKTKRFRLLVFCSANENMAQDFKTLASDLGKNIAIHNWDLVYGGASASMMGKLAQSFIEYKKESQIIGIFSTSLSALESEQPGLDECLHLPHLQDRKQKMMEISDLAIVMPGGLGTLDEALSVFSSCAVGEKHLPLVFLNYQSYWQHLSMLFDHMRSCGSMSDAQFKNTYWVNNNLELIDLLKTLQKEA